MSSLRSRLKIALDRTRGRQYIAVDDVLALQAVANEAINRVEEKKPVVEIKTDDVAISDGYHTFDELYEHRSRLFIALAERHPASWCSKLHSDGTMFNGWFVMGLYGERGKQITYHLPIEKWDECAAKIEVLDRAPEWDGHSPEDVLERLKEIW